MNHEELVREAEKLAKGMKPAQLIHRAFVYSYVANHELRIMMERISNLHKLVWSILMVLALTLVCRILFGI